MQYLFGIFSILFSFIVKANAKTPSSGYCFGNQCFAVFHYSSDFATAKKHCADSDGHLMTIRSSMSNNTLSLLLKDLGGDFWIGLHLPNGQCPNTTAEMRGYKWITGDSASAFQNWGVYDDSCSSDCVSVSNNGNQWSQESCSKQKAGFLCEFSFSKTCSPLQGGEAVHYRTPQGLEGNDMSSLPPGSIAIQQPLELKYICFDDEWIMAPWQCEIDKGGCGFDCIVVKQKNVCFCPSGEDLKSNNSTCENVQNDPCLMIGCDHVCLKNTSPHTCTCRPGYELASDGKTCNEINYCLDERQCPLPNFKCIKNVGGFKCVCQDGFRMVGDKCIDIDECKTYTCEHTCKNTPGGYECSCNEGYIEHPDNPDQCTFVCGREECQAECDPNNPSECFCPNGYILDDEGHEKICLDLDECEMYTCDQKCINTFGGYICSCIKGYDLVDLYKCVKNEDKEVSKFTTPYNVLTIPTAFYPTEKPTGSSMSAGGLLGIIVCLVLAILAMVCLAHHLLKRRGKLASAKALKTQCDDAQDLQQITTEKYEKAPSERHLKQDI